MGADVPVRTLADAPWSSARSDHTRWYRLSPAKASSHPALVFGPVARIRVIHASARWLANLTGGRPRRTGGKYSSAGIRVFQALIAFARWRRMGPLTSQPVQTAR